MIVDDLRLEGAGDRAELSARLRLESAAEAPERIWFRLPVGGELDGSPFVPGLLLAAMALGEELVVDAPVSLRLLEGVGRAKAVFRSWWPELADVPVRAEAGAPTCPRSTSPGDRGGRARPRSSGSGAPPRG